MTGYVRKDTSNNIADGNIINAADLDAEFDGVQDAFNASTGHKHDGTAGEGAPITAVGPTQDVTVSASLVAPKTTNTVDLGSSSLKFKDIYIVGTASLPTVNATTVDTTNIEVTNIKAKDGTASASIADSTGVMTIASVILTTADINGGTIDGTAIGGTTPAAGAFLTLSSTGNTTLGDAAGDVITINGATTFANVNPTLSAGTANGVAYLNGSKVLTTGSALTFDGTNLGVNSSSTIDGGRFSVAFAGNTQNGIGLKDTADASGASFWGAYNSTGGFIGSLRRSGTDNALAINGNSYLAFQQNSSEQMRLTSTGLGIGTSSPSHKLSVAGGVFSNNSTNSAFLTAGSQYYGSIANTSGANTYSLGYSTDGSTHSSVLYWNASGNLGLGVTPSAFSASYKGFEIGAVGNALTSASTVVNLSTNAVRGASWTYGTTGRALLYQQDSGAGSHAWYNAASGSGTITFTQAMTLDASGNLGIGTTSPQGQFHVANTAGDCNSYYQASTSGLSQLIFYDGAVAGKIAYRHATDALEFTVNGSERARIDSSGSLLVGTTTLPSGSSHIIAGPVSAWAFNGRNLATSGVGYGILASFAYSPNNTDALFFGGEDTTTGRFYVRSNGGIANYSANDVNLSDRREKTNFAPAGEYLPKICAIPVQTFNYIDQNLEEDPGTTLGVVAQDVQAVAPELVMESNWGTKDEPKMRLSIYQTDLQYALMKCIQEQQAIINTLTARVAALESK